MRGNFNYATSVGVTCSTRKEQFIKQPGFTQNPKI